VIVLNEIENENGVSRGWYLGLTKFTNELIDVSMYYFEFYEQNALLMSLKAN
jgi:hypothetical protein